MKNMKDIRFAEILTVEPILKNAKKELSEENPVKAYKLTIDNGSEHRTVVSAIVDLFKPEQLLGITTPFVMDMEPKEIRGFMSEAMIFLDEKENGGASLILGGKKGAIFTIEQ
jgi:methionyl-tRNA synthetase